MRIPSGNGPLSAKPVHTHQVQHAGLKQHISGRRTFSGHGSSFSPEILRSPYTLKRIHPVRNGGGRKIPGRLAVWLFQTDIPSGGRHLKPSGCENSYNWKLQYRRAVLYGTAQKIPLPHFCACAHGEKTGDRPRRIFRQRKNSVLTVRTFCAGTGPGPESEIPV